MHVYATLAPHTRRCPRHFGVALAALMSSPDNIAMKYRSLRVSLTLSDGETWWLCCNVNVCPPPRPRFCRQQMPRKVFTCDGDEEDDDVYDARFDVEALDEEAPATHEQVGERLIVEG